MSEPNRAPATTWCLRREQFYPMVYTLESELIAIEDHPHGYIEISRKDARLLAKRINQCLDATAKR